MTGALTLNYILKRTTLHTEFLKIRIIQSENTEQWSSCHNVVHRAAILNLSTQIYSQKALISDPQGLLIISISRYEIQTMMNLVTYFAPLKYYNLSVEMNLSLLAKVMHTS